jgi:hypothetical protein
MLASTVPPVSLVAAALHDPCHERASLRQAHATGRAGAKKRGRSYLRGGKMFRRYSRSKPYTSSSG